MPIFIGLVVVILLIVGIGWLGTQVPLRSFKTPPHIPALPHVIHQPHDLPAPVARYARTLFGPDVPCIDSALVMGKAHLTFMGITFPARFKFYYEAGQAYYHLIQLGWFGYPILTVHERYQDGEAILALPGNLVQHNANTNAAANLGMWAECIWVPSIWFTDSRLQWQAIDDTTARLIVPNADDEETFVVRFDPNTNLITSLTTKRFQGTDSKERLAWINRALAWQTIGSTPVPVEAEIQWGHDKPWAQWHVRHILYNVDVAARLAEFGGMEID